MNNRIFLLLLLLVLSITGFSIFSREWTKPKLISPVFKIYEVEPGTPLNFFYKDKAGKPYNNFYQLKENLKSKGKEILFAMNGGMFHSTGRPVGLYIQEGKEIEKLNTDKNQKGNFFLQPNGVFSETISHQFKVSKTTDFNPKNIYNATQSGPLLVYNDTINPLFNPKSKNLNIRNGVGVKENGNVLFAISTEPVTFYEMAQLFKNHNCPNALYLDGFVSKAVFPGEEIINSTDKFGVIITHLKN